MKNILGLVSLIVVTILIGYKLETSSATMSSNTTAYRGIYIDGFDSILGDETKENLLLNWCVSNKFNAISLYRLNQVMGSSQGLANLPQFIQKAYITFGIEQVAAVRGTAANFDQNARYDSSRTDPEERFTVYNLENEWWNSASCDFSCYPPILQAMNVTAKSETPPIITEAYIGWFRNPTGQELSQAYTLVESLDRILVHEYTGSPSLNYITDRLSYLGAAAKCQNRIIDVIVIFSAEHDSMYDYFNAEGQNHSFDDAYLDILEQFNTASFKYKDYVNLIGYQIYPYSDAQMARPAYTPLI